MEARSLNLMDYHYSWLRWWESRELLYMGWFLYRRSVIQWQWTLWVGLSIWVVINSCEQEYFFQTISIKQDNALLVTSDSDFTVGQSWLGQLRSAFMTLPFLRNAFDTIRIWFPTSRFPQGIFTVFLSSADPATVLFSFLSSLIYSVIVSRACGFWEGWLAGSVRHKHWNVCPRGGSQISSQGPEANSCDGFMARNSKNQNGYCRPSRQTNKKSKCWDTSDF